MSELEEIPISTAERVAKDHGFDQLQERNDMKLLFYFTSRLEVEMHFIRMHSMP